MFGSTQSPTNLLADVSAISGTTFNGIYGYITVVIGLLACFFIIRGIVGMFDTIKANAEQPSEGEYSKYKRIMAGSEEKFDSELTDEEEYEKFERIMQGSSELYDNEL